MSFSRAMTRAQAVIGRGKFAAHDHVNAARDAAGITVGILLPGTNCFNREQRAPDIAEEHFAVARLGLGELLRVEGGNALFELMERFDLLIDASARIVFEQIIVLMKAVGSTGRMERI